MFENILDAAAKATLLFGAAAKLSGWLRRGSAASRHLVWTCALLPRSRDRRGRRL